MELAALAIVLQHVNKHAVDSPKALETAGEIFNVCLTCKDLFDQAPRDGPMRRHGMRLNLVRRHRVDNCELHKQMEDLNLITDECSENWYALHFEGCLLFTVFVKRGSFHNKRTPAWCVKYFEEDDWLYDVVKYTGVLDEVDVDWFASHLSDRQLFEMLENTGRFETEEFSVKWCVDHFYGFPLYNALLKAGHLEGKDVYWCTSHMFVEKRASLMILTHAGLLQEFVRSRLTNLRLTNFSLFHKTVFNDEECPEDASLEYICGTIACYTEWGEESSLVENDKLWDILFSYEP